MIKTDEFGRTDIFYSVVNGDESQFLKLLATTDDINTKDKNEMTLLHFCAEYSRVSMAKSLIKRGIDLGAKDIYGNTPLWKAVFNSRGRYELAQLLIDHGANPNSANKAGKSPLDFATTIQDKELTKILTNG